MLLSGILGLINCAISRGDDENVPDLIIQVYGDDAPTYNDNEKVQSARSPLIAQSRTRDIYGSMEDY